MIARLGELRCDTDEPQRDLLTARTVGMVTVGMTAAPRGRPSLTTVRD
ncbi:MULTISPECIES: hypothetical protein [Prauserella salsuginis group]|uniref:Uncharacterized protein n=1 Tax=Prauserella salsuginis TaxID=387889 RepID=A0ABW6FZS2_9PSEU|nr:MULTISPECIES: hypothetical protein [Prauserella salsuginis group]